MEFESCFEEYHHSKVHAGRQSTLQAARRWFGDCRPDSVRTVRAALGSVSWRAPFAAAIFRELDLPEALAPDFAQAALRWGDPGDNRSFVHAAVFTLEPERTARALIAEVQPGSEDDVAGASDAFHWLRMMGDFLVVRSACLGGS